MLRELKFWLLVAGLAWLPVARTLAGPPFLTDDPEPVDFQHWETYLFATGVHGPGSAHTINGPAVELNYGVLPDTQLHLIVPMASVGGGGVTSASGLGDLEMGVKYRLVHETNGWPQIGVFPLVELPTGDAGQGLGNGRAWFRLPVWLQKSWGSWTSYGGGGAALNSAPGMRDYPFGGWLVQRDLDSHLTLGGEVFAQGQDTDQDQGYVACNLGGSVNVNEHFSLLFSGGHSLAGDNHTLWYFGLYWTW